MKFEGPQLLFIFVLILASMIMVSGNLGTFAQNDCVEIKTILNTSSVNLSTISYPNSTTLYLNTPMTQNGKTFNYSFCNTSTVGEYVYDYYDASGNVYVNNFFINPSGIAQNESRTKAVSNGIYFLFGIAIVLFIGFLFVKQSVPIKWTLFLISIMFFLQSINLLFLNLQEEIVNPSIEGYFSFLTAASFYLFWFAFGLLAILWFLTILQTLLFKQAMRNLQKYGGD